MQVKIWFKNSYNEDIDDEVVLGRDDTITFIPGDIEVRHQPERHEIHNLSLKKKTLTRVEITI